MIKFAALAIATSVFSIVSALPADASNRTRVCKPENVGVFNNRIHVKCAPISGQAYTSDIRYYAMKLTDTPQVTATLQLLLFAKAHNRQLSISFDESDYQSVPGCQGGDCRRLRWVTMK